VWETPWLLRRLTCF